MRSRILATVRGEAEIFASERDRGHAIVIPRQRRVAHGLALLVAASLGALAMLIALTAGGETSMSVHAAGPQAVLHRVGSRAELVLSGMSEPPEGQVYELWIQRAGARPDPTDVLFTVTGAGRGTVEVPGGLRGLNAVLVTREPRGGSSVPSGPPILRVAVPHSL